MFKLRPETVPRPQSPVPQPRREAPVIDAVPLLKPTEPQLDEETEKTKVAYAYPPSELTLEEAARQEKQNALDYKRLTVVKQNLEWSAAQGRKATEKNEDIIRELEKESELTATAKRRVREIKDEIARRELAVEKQSLSIEIMGQLATTVETILEEADGLRLMHGGNTVKTALKVQKALRKATKLLDEHKIGWKKIEAAEYAL